LVDGQANFAYALPSNATAVAITIRNQSGVQVLTVPGEITAGRHTFAWDGLDLQGVQQPDGKYTITVTAVGSNGQSLGVQTYTAGLVDGADSSGDTVKLTIRGVEVPLSDVVAIKEPPANT
jgi:flagellar basal-body rod modification protein FlgD